MSLMTSLRRLQKRLARKISGWTAPLHPFDVDYGIETARIVPAKKLAVDNAIIDGSNSGYVGSQPSLIRSAIAELGDVSTSAFVDLGSGKGRALIVASEFNFNRIIGVEISADLCAKASQNVATVMRKFPDRTRIEIINGDATIPQKIEADTIVYFMYHAFGRDLVQKFLNNLETYMQDHLRQKIFIIYYNSVHYAEFDNSTKLERFDAWKGKFSREEAASSAFGNDFDSVVMYQSKTGEMRPALAGAYRKVKISVENWGADVVMEG